MKTAGFFDHLDELRRRAMRSAVMFLICAGFFYPSAGQVLSFILAPAGQLVFLSPADAFSAYWSTVLWGGFVFSFPYILYQFWSFVAEGLKPEERRVIHVCGLLSFGLFIVGVLFAFLVMIPFSFNFLLSYATPQLVPMITVDRYLGFVWSFVIAFGVVFEMPLVIFALTRLGVVTVDVLRKGRPYAIVIILIIAAVLTPPDVVSQIILAVPMIILYEVGILLARVGQKQKTPCG